LKTIEKLYVGIEIGATKQQIAVGKGDGTLLKVIQEKIPLYRGAEDVLDWLKVKIPVLLEAEEFKGRIEALSAGFGGPLESSTGRIISSIQVPGWENFALRNWLIETFSLPAIVTNDTVTGGYAELYLGCGKNERNIFYTNIGSGIGGAIFINRDYYDGIGCGAGYLGNSYVPDWTVDIPGMECKVEKICSGLNISTRLQQPGYVPVDSAIMRMCNGDRSVITPKMLEDAGKEGDVFALMEIDRIARSFSIGLCNVLALVAPKLIVIGGGLAKMGDLLFDPIRKYTEKLTFVANKGRFRIEKSQLLDDAVICGAIICAARSKMVSDT
jgi:glucokinase